MNDVTKPNEPEFTPLKRAFLALEEAQARLARAEAAMREPIAIIGMGCRVPGADDPASLWRLLSAGIDAVTSPPAGRFADDGTREALRDAGYLSRVDGFDPGFFGISKREADGMDPQQRLLLEVSWDALESAGQAPDRLEHSRTGVYVGLGSSDYNILELTTGDPTVVNPHYASGVAHSVASGRISYVLGLQGPSISIDTACSSSLVAVHMACQALRTGDCRMALAGGVNLMLSTEPFVAFAESRMLAPDGRCKTFDAAADGFARGEGCGVVVLKRLTDAQADGDTVLAVISGSAVNQDGPSSGLTAPNGPAQEAVIRDALRNAALLPRDIGYIEAHGTGTQLGDPLEVQALGEVFGRDRDPANPLLLGAVKTNIGHLEAAAGVASLIKVVLALQHQAIPAHLHFREPSPHIAWSQLPIRVPTALTPWTPIAGRRIAGISSFGFSGTNAHVIVEQAPTEADRPLVAQRAAELFTLSARSEAALRSLAARTHDALGDGREVAIADLCFTASAGRAHLAERATIVASGVPALRTALGALGRGELPTGMRRARVGRRDPPRVAFLFTGQGSQYAGMARDLYAQAPVFRAALDRCAAVLDRHMPCPLLEVMHQQDRPARLVDQTAYTQPALFALEFALSELWESWGVQPSIVLGHSVGEYVAACVAGVMELEPALELIAARGRLMQSLPAGGGMTAIFADTGEVAAAVQPYAASVAIAAVNAPGQTVISGRAEDVESIGAKFVARGIRIQPLTVSHAFHSPLVDPILDEFERLAANVRFGAPGIRLISNRSGRVATAAELAEPSYWRDHLRQAVLFDESLKTLGALKPDLCIELGPHPALLGFAKMSFGETGPVLLHTLRKDRPDWTQMLDALAGVHLAGVEIEWRKVFEGQSPRIVALPSYPFERERCWFSARRRGTATTGAASGHPLLGNRIRSAGAERIHEFRLSAATPGFLAQHRVQGQIVMPATGLLESLLAASQELLGPRTTCIENVTLKEALLVEDDPDVERIVQVVLAPAAEGRQQLKISSAQAREIDGTGWTEHVLASVSAEQDSAGHSWSLSDARARCTVEVSRDAFYARFAARGLDFGPAFQSIRRIWRGVDCALGEVGLADDLAVDTGSYRVHPVLLDGCVQVIAAAVADDGDDSLYLPFSIGRYVLHRSPGTRCFGHARLDAGATGATRHADVAMFDPDGNLVAELTDIRLKRVSADALSRLGNRWLDDALYDVGWVEAAISGATSTTQVPIEDLRSGALAALAGLRREAGLDTYDAFLPQLDCFCLELVVRAMHRLGWTPAAGERIVPESLAARLGVAPRHHRLFSRLLEILAEGGYLAADPAGWVVGRPLAAQAPALDGAALLAAYPAAAAEIEMTDRAGSQFAEALRGECDPLQLLFPGGSLDTAEKLYRDTPPARVFNGLMAVTAGALAVNRPAGRPLRILEIGAGTGGTTAHVLPHLLSGDVEYTFTDIGAMFVARARERFSAYPFMRFATLDLEIAPGAQGFQSESYDLILASNVIHATRDLRRTLAGVKQLLAPGGTLAMLEVTAPQRWFDLTVGLTEGWWCFEDADLRPSYATLSRGRWISLLNECGFAEAVAVPGDGQESPTLDLNTMLLARIDDVSAAGRPRGWIVFAEGAGAGSTLVERLRAAGDRCVLVRPASVFGVAGDEATIDPGQPEHYRLLLTRIAASMGTIHGVVHAWSTNRVRSLDEPASALADAALTGAVSAMDLARAIVSAGVPARLWLLTQGAQEVGPGDRALDPAQAVMFGLARTLFVEHPELRCVCIDLDPDAPEGDCEQLLTELAESGAEGQVAFRRGHRMVARLLRARPAASPSSVDAPEHAAWRMKPAVAGSLDRFERVALERRRPGPGEVEIEVHATGLNFKDVLNVLGMYPGDPGPLGGECAGVVTAVGAGVAHLRAGDEVLALAAGSFASHVTTRAEFVQLRPPGQSAAEGASVPIAFLTAQFCLAHLAGLKRDERVLIHAAAGGVGMAAVRLALKAGAQVFATAGSAWKRDLLRSMGVQHVFDSRSPTFLDDVMTATNGVGVDVVLNSLSGEMIDASFGAIARGGRFVEIGKRGIKSQDAVAALGRDLRYFVVDWGDTASRDPALIGRMFAELAARLHSGALAPLPRHTFAIDDASRAFRFMAQARHAGKIVVTQQKRTSVTVQKNGTYLVTGGLAGLGPVVALWLAERGAGRLVLVSRRGATSQTEPLLQQLRASGADVVAETLDVSDEAGLRIVLERLRNSGPPLRGIVHSAGVLDDASLVQQDAGRFARVFAPKVHGAAVLDTLTRGDPLDWVVYFSSIAAVLGSPGQSNHSSANAFLDLLARDLRHRGLPVSSINWGPWTEVGAAVERGVAARAAGQGVFAISPAQGLQALERVIVDQAAQAVVLPMDWARFRAHTKDRELAPFLSTVSQPEAPTRAAASVAVTRAGDLRQQLADAPATRRRPIIAAFVRERALKVLGLDASKAIDPRTPLGDLGLDSLLAVELRNAIGTALGRSLPATLLFDYPTSDALTDHLLVELCGNMEVPPTDSTAETAPSKANLVESIEDLTDEEVERQLAERARRNH